VIEPSESDDRTLADPDDQPVLGTLIAALQAARADYLITGDKALLALGERHPIVTPAAFWAAHGGV
jgi:predicted nucleic acid-binding protein